MGSCDLLVYSTINCIYYDTPRINLCLLCTWLHVFFVLSHVLCKQVGEEQELIYGHITHVIFLLCRG